ncbi:Protein DDI1 2 [Nymphon striatum]|nr:Protein DDI1 2 [Nymphon striatum]
MLPKCSEGPTSSQREEFIVVKSFWVPDHIVLTTTVKMKLTVTTLTEDLLTLDVSDDLELENFKALCECETGIATNDMVILFEGRPLLDSKKSLKDYGLKDNDVVLMQTIPAQNQTNPTSRSPLPFPIDFSQIQVPSSALGEERREHSSGNSSTSPTQIPSHSVQSDDPTYIRQMFLSNPDKLAMLKQNNPRLAEALLANDLDLFDKIRKEQMAEKAEKDRQRIRMLNADPFDTEAQKMIAEEIRCRFLTVLHSVILIVLKEIFLGLGNTILITLFA